MSYRVYNLLIHSAGIADKAKIPLKKIDKKRKYLHVFANDEITNLFAWADENSDFIGFDFIPDASTSEYLVVTNSSGNKFDDVRNKIKKLGLKTKMIRRTPRVMHDIDDNIVQEKDDKNINEIACDTVAKSILAYKPRVQRQRKTKGPQKLKNKMYYRKNKHKIKRKQKLYKRKNKPGLTRRKKLKHYKRIR